MAVESTSSLVRTETVGSLATVTLDNPPLNTLSLPLVGAIAAAHARLDEDDDVRAIVLTGNERAFSAGADVREFAGKSRDEATAAIAAYGDLMDNLARSGTPTIAAIRGFCFGGGLELALACDFRVAARDAQLGLPEVRLGLLPGAGGTQILPRLVGPRRAALLCQTGRPVDGERAYEWGLVEEVVDDGDALTVAAEIGRSLAGNARAAVDRVRTLMRASLGLPLEEGIGLERKAFLEALLSPDGREGIAAFLERRPPRWSALRLAPQANAG
jgi:enoyl-CoA hydratase/carnithine racemase